MAMSAMAGQAAVPHVLSGLPAGIAAVVLCLLVVIEIAAVPGIVLPGGTVTLLAGVLASTARAPLAVAVPVAAAVIIGDHLAYRSGPAVIISWRWRGPGRARTGPNAGRAPSWLAAVPSLAGAARMPYPGFAARLLAIRLPWLAGMLAAGALAARAAASAERSGGTAAAAALAVAVIAAPAVCGRLPVHVMARRPSPGRLLLAATALAAAACAMLVPGASGGQPARLNPRVAVLLARHVHPDAASKAVSISGLAEPPGLWFMVAMAVMFLNVKRRGGSTARITAAAGASLAIAAALNAALPGWDHQQALSLGTTAVAALGITTALLACRWLEPRKAQLAVAAITAAAASLTLALGIAGQPFTALAAGACLGTAVTTSVEAAARHRWGRWLADQPAAPAP